MYNLTMQECRSWRLFWTVFQEHHKIFPHTHNTFISWWCRNFSVFVIKIDMRLYI